MRESLPLLDKDSGACIGLEHGTIGSACSSLLANLACTAGGSADVLAALASLPALVRMLCQAIGTPSDARHELCRFFGALVRGSAAVRKELGADVLSLGALTRAVPWAAQGAECLPLLRALCALVADGESGFGASAVGELYTGEYCMLIVLLFLLLLLLMLLLLLLLMRRLLTQG